MYKRQEYDGVMHPLRWGLARSRNNYSAWIMKQAKQQMCIRDRQFFAELFRHTLTKVIFYYFCTK